MLYWCDIIMHVLKVIVGGVVGVSFWPCAN